MSNFNLSKEDFDFLIELQHEMLTQDHTSQAAPRFWTIATDKHQELGTIDCFDGTSLYSSYNGEIVCEGDIKSIIEYVTKHYSEKLESYTFIDEDTYFKVKFDEDEEETFFDSDELLEFLIDHDIIDDSHEIIYYRNVHYIYPNTMFLTNRSCKEHIKANHYHYNDDAHSYAMTAWRSPEVSRLFEILDKIDWKVMKKEVYGPEDTIVTEESSRGSE